MKKELKDYLHLYLGCECFVMGEEGIFKLTGISYDDTQRTWWTYFENTELAYAIIDDTKPILRHLSDMTNEEFYEFKIIADSDASKMVHIVNVKDMTTNLFHEFEATKFLLSKHFDLFGLIESGHAVNAAEINSVSSR